jgi:cytochrome c-type biogenesis protein CcmH/NrfG
MAKAQKTIKGYIKTENMILFLFVAAGIGFLSGVVFSAWRTGTAGMPASVSTPPQASAKPPMNQKQRQTLDALLQATRTTPDNVQAWEQLGHFYFDAGEHQKAIDAYKKSLELDDKRPNIWIDLGVMYRRAGEPDKAIETFEKALSLDPRHEIALFNIGVVQMHDLKDVKAARTYWERLVEINPQATAPGGQSIQSMLSELKKNDPS